jgi:hypothetical protein
MVDVKSRRRQGFWKVMSLMAKGEHLGVVTDMFRALHQSPAMVQSLGADPRHCVNISEALDVDLRSLCYDIFD